VEARARKLGHQGIIRMRLWGSEMFYGHLMAGPSAAVPSFLASPTGGASLSPAVAQGPSLRPIGRNEPVLVDYVFAYQGYISDHTRVFAVGGVSEDLQRAHRAMLQIQEKVKVEARAGVKSGDIYDFATTLAEELGYGEHFMGSGPQRIRFTGHGIGLELDEFPFLAKGQDLRLEENMVIAFEPKLIFPGVGVVGIENSHVVTKDGLRQLGRFEEDIVVV
jgi:Xaa-Pro aminopeptidase